jgi:hypothetical protein
LTTQQQTNVSFFTLTRGLLGQAVGWNFLSPDQETEAGNENCTAWEITKPSCPPPRSPNSFIFISIAFPGNGQEFTEKFWETRRVDSLNLGMSGPTLRQPHPSEALVLFLASREQELRGVAFLECWTPVACLRYFSEVALRQMLPK